MRRPLLDFATCFGPGYFLRLAALEHLFEGLHGSRFLEIGPGRGDVAAWLVSSGSSCTLVDSSKASVEFLRARFAKQPEVTILHSEGALDLPVSTPFDFAVALEVLEHVEDDMGMLAAVHRQLKPGGTLVASVPAFMSRWGDSDECVGHFRRYEEAGLRDLLARAGFTVVSLLCHGFPACAVFGLARKLYYGRTMHRLRGESAADRSRRSGVERPVGVRSRLLARAAFLLLSPMVLVQRATLHRTLGDGWIAVARRSCEGP